MSVADQASGLYDLRSEVLVLAAALTLTILVHEVGHLIAGWLLGFRFSYIRVGPFRLHLNSGKLNMGLLWETTALGETGMRTGGVNRLRRRLVLYAVGGPGANVLIVPMAFVFAKHYLPVEDAARVVAFPIATIFAIPTSFASTHPLAISLCAQLTFISIILAITNIMPVPLGRRSASDGSRIATLLTDRKRCRRYLAISAVRGQYQKGVHPKNWRQTWLRAACSVPDESVDDFWGHWFAYLSASAKSDKNAAGVHLETCLRLSRFHTRSIRNMAALEAASFSAWFLNDAGLSDKWLAQIKRMELVPPFARFRLFVGRCCARCDFRQALQLWGKELERISHLPGSSVKRALLAIWLELREQILLRHKQANLAATFDSPPRLRLTQDEELQKKFGLTTHDIEIVSAVVAGYSNKEVADYLNLHEHTVECQLRDIFDKLGISSRFDLTANKSTRLRRFPTVPMLCGLGGLVCAVVTSRISLLIVGMIVGMTVLASQWAAEFLAATRQPRGYVRRRAMERASMFALGALCGSLCVAAALGDFHWPFLSSWLISALVLFDGGSLIAKWRYYHND